MKVRGHLTRPAPGRKRRNGIMPVEVTRAIRHAIFHGEFQPGDPLQEIHLAKRYGVSQAVVREALSALAYAGLVRRYPNKGTFVTNLSPKDIREHVRLRMILETTAWLDAAARATPRDFDALRKRLQAMAAAVEASDHDAAAQADLEFHRQIWRMSGDDTLARLLDQISVPLFAFVSLRRSQRHDDLSRLVPAHEAIVSALAAGDTNEIVRMVQEQTGRSYAGFLQPGADQALSAAVNYAEKERASPGSAAVPVP
jgi:DNA-binding GntR family transcriptional regulator